MTCMREEVRMDGTREGDRGGKEVREGKLWVGSEDGRGKK